jgi:hypothetical protein
MRAEDLLPLCVHLDWESFNDLLKVVSEANLSETLNFSQAWLNIALAIKKNREKNPCFTILLSAPDADRPGNLAFQVVDDGGAHNLSVPLSLLI